jgi:hypothetical protein
LQFSPDNLSAIIAVARVFPATIAERGRTFIGMKYEFIYERSQTAGRMEAVMLIVTVVALVAAVFAFLNYGWLPSLGFLVLSSIAFALSRLFDLIGDLFNSPNVPQERAKSIPAEQAKH